MRETEFQQVHQGRNTLPFVRTAHRFLPSRSNSIRLRSFSSSAALDVVEDLEEFLQSLEGELESGGKIH